MIHLDGSTGEGGGQILRTALALSTITQQPFAISNIRASRPKPGLKAQHLHCIDAYNKLSSSTCSSATLGSSEITFSPGTIQSTSLSIDIGTAGSIPLLLQSLLPALITSKQTITLTLQGGTDTRWAPQWDVMMSTLLPHLRGGNIQPKLMQRGYYPKGGGKSMLEIQPFAKHTSIELTNPGNIKHINGTVHVHQALKPKQIGERMRDAALMSFDTVSVPKRITVEYVDSPSIGGGISLWAERTSPKGNILLGVDRLIAKGHHAESIGTECGNILQTYLDKPWCVDEHLQDQLIPYLALFGGIIEGPPLTSHTRTNMHICEVFLQTKFHLTEMPPKTIIQANAYKPIQNN